MSDRTNGFGPEDNKDFIWLGIKWFFLGLIFIMIVGFVGNSMNWFNIWFWQTKTQDAQRQVFENTQSYVEGKRQELIKYHHEWMKADSNDKEAIEATIRMSFANFDEKKIEQPELYNFLKRIKGN